MDLSLSAGALTAFFSVVVIDLVLAGDNAIVIAVVAAGLAPEHRRRVIIFGTAIATVLRIALSLIAMRLLEIVGLTLAGGILLLWVAWKLYRELRQEGGAALARSAEEARPKSFTRALFQVAAADLSMSLDNALAVAGSARDHWVVLVFGLILSVGLTAVASSVLARLLGRYRWIAWIGLIIVTAVALRMIYDGSIEVAAVT